MRTFHAIVAAACLLAAPLACGAECIGKVSRAALVDSGGRIGVVSPLGADVQGRYALSNGQRVTLVNHYQDLVAVFDAGRPVRLREVGQHRFASPEGDVQLSWAPSPREDTIRLSYPADAGGRLRRSCD